MNPRVDRPERCAAPGVAVSWEGRPAGLLADVAPFVDAIEIVPDCLVEPGGRRIAGSHIDELQRFLDHWPAATISIHGVGLSLGTATAWNEQYLHVLHDLLARLPIDRVRWHSEHIGFTTVAGSPLGTMPALPCTAEAIELVVARTRALRREFDLPVLLEHVASPLRRDDEMTLATFLNTIAVEAGCGIILDLHNLACDAWNGLLDLPRFLTEIDRSAVREMHVAGGIWRDHLRLDVHADVIATDVLTMFDAVWPTCPALELVTYEVLAEATTLLGTPTIIDQLVELRRRLDADARSTAA